MFGSRQITSLSNLPLEGGKLDIRSLVKVLLYVHRNRVKVEVDIGSLLYIAFI